MVTADVTAEGSRQAEAAGYDDDDVKRRDEEFLAQMRSQAHSLINEEYAEFLRRHLEEMGMQGKTEGKQGSTDTKGADTAPEATYNVSIK